MAIQRLKRENIADGAVEALGEETSEDEEAGAEIEMTTGDGHTMVETIVEGERMTIINAVGTLDPDRMIRPDVAMGMVIGEARTEIEEVTGALDQGPGTSMLTGGLRDR